MDVVIELIIFGGTSSASGSQGGGTGGATFYILGF